MMDAERGGRASTATSSTSATPRLRSAWPGTSSAACCNGVESGWNSAFWVDSRRRAAHRRPRTPTPWSGSARRSTSPPSTPRRSGHGGIGLYTKEWGTLRKLPRRRRPAPRTSGWSWSAGARSSRTAHGSPGSLRVTGKVLVGRDAGAGELARLRAARGSPPRWRSRSAEDGDHRQHVPAARRRPGREGRPWTCTRAPRSASTATPARCCCWSWTGGRTSAAAATMVELADAVRAARCRGRAQPRRRRLVDHARRGRPTARSPCSTPRPTGSRGRSPTASRSPTTPPPAAPAP